MKSVKKRTLALAGMTAFAVGSVLVPATAAQATPAHCSGVYEGHQYRTYCYGGTGSFRSVVKCYRSGSETSYVTRYGVWQATGSTSSIAVCRSTEEPTSGYAQLR